MEGDRSMYVASALNVQGDETTVGLAKSARRGLEEGQLSWGYAGTGRSCLPEVLVPSLKLFQHSCGFQERNVRALIRKWSGAHTCPECELSSGASDWAPDGQVQPLPHLLNLISLLLDPVRLGTCPARHSGNLLGVSEGPPG